MDSLALVSFSDGVDCTGDQDPRGGWTGAKAGEVFFRAGDVDDVRGESLQPPSSRPQNGSDVVVEGVDAVVDGFEVGVECGKGCAHFVSEVGQHSASGGLGGVESSGEFVDTVGEIVELAAQAWANDPRVVASTGDLGSRGGHGGDGVLNSPGEIPTHQQRQ